MEREKYLSLPTEKYMKDIMKKQNVWEQWRRGKNVTVSNLGKYTEGKVEEITLIGRGGSFTKRCKIERISSRERKEIIEKYEHLKKLKEIMNC